MVDARLTRQGAEVLLQPGPIVSIPRVSLEALVDPDDGTGATRLTRQGVEVLYLLPPIIGVPRVSLEALVDPDDGTGAVRLTRQGVEILYPRPPIGPSPLPFPTNYEVFIHDWKDGVRLLNGYMTDVTSSATTGAEERRILRDKPQRILSVALLNTSKAILDRLFANLRRHTTTRVPMPLYCDESIGTADSNSGQTSVWCDTTLRRFFIGGRVLIVPHTIDNFVARASLDVGVIESIEADHLILEDDLALSFTSGRFSVYPLIDCEILLVPGLTLKSHQIAEALLELQEVLGANTLPASRDGRPLDMPLLEGLPVLNLNLDQDFANGVAVGFVRDGESFGRGRGTVVSPNDYRYKQVTEWNMLATTRTAAWKVVQFLDWARGRGRAFFAMDEEDLWTAVSVTSSFIEIDPLGFYADFSEAFGYVGIEMMDGTVHARKVNTIQDLTTVWRITCTGDALPSLDLTQIRRVSRVRKSRLVDDSFTEDWRTLSVCRFRFSTTETLDEGEETT